MSYLAKICLRCGAPFLRPEDKRYSDARWSRMTRCPECRWGRSLESRFFDFVRKTETCWLWVGGTSIKTGNMRYGTFAIKAYANLAHRVSWEIHFGAIPVGMQVCHHCDVPLCVRPDHLFLGTQKDNSCDMMRKGRGRGQFKPGENSHAAGAQ